MKNIVKGLFLVAMLAVVAAPVMVGAQPINIPAPVDVNAGPGTIYGIITQIINIAFIVLMLLAVLMIIWAAFKYLTAQGNPENVETAQRMLLYAVIAIVIGLLARSVPAVISYFLKGNVVNSTYQ